MSVTTTFYERKIKNLFKNLYDTNNDDFITFEDFEISIERFRVGNNLKEDDPKIIAIHAALKDLFDHLLKKADYNKDGKISFDEYLQYWSEVAVEIRKGTSLADLDLKKLFDFTFNSLDIDSDGVFSEADYKAAVKSVNAFTEQEINSAWEKVAQLGRLDHKGFEKALITYLSSHQENDNENYILGPISLKS